MSYNSTFLKKTHDRQKGANGTVTDNGIEGIGHYGEDMFADPELNAMNAAFHKEDQKQIASEFLDIYRDDNYLSSRGEKPFLMNPTKGKEEAYRAAEQLLAEVASSPDGRLSQESLDRIGSLQSNPDVGRAYLDIAASQVATGGISSKKAALGFDELVRNNNPTYSAFLDSSVRTHVVLFPEHYQYLDPKTRETMDPALALRAAQDLARIEVVGNFSLADKNGQLRTTVENTDTKWSPGHESIFTEKMKQENKALETSLAAVVTEEKKKEEAKKETEEKKETAKAAEAPASGKADGATKEGQSSSPSSETASKSESKADVAANTMRNNNVSQPTPVANPSDTNKTPPSVASNTPAPSQSTGRA